METKQTSQEHSQAECCKNGAKHCAGACDKEPPREEGASNRAESPKNWEAEKADLIETLQRVVADFDNYKKRASKERRETEAIASADLIIDLLPALDNFEMALSLDKDSDPDARKGREMIYASLVSVLEKRGLASIDSIGQQFDPRLHEALLTCSGPQKNQIIEVLQKGYTLNGKVIRTAKVKISS